MSTIRIRRSDSIDVITSPVSFTYRMASPHLFNIRRVLSYPDLSCTTAQTKGILRTSSDLYGLSGSRQDFSLSRHKSYSSPRYDRTTDFSISYRPYYRDYGYRRHWGYYGRPPYVNYYYSPTPSSSYQWWLYPSSYYYPRVTRTDYFDPPSLSGGGYQRRYRESYYIPSQFQYTPRYRRYAY